MKARRPMSVLRGWSKRVLLLSLAVFAAERVACAIDRPRNQIVVSPQGPQDGGDFGPRTPGTKTSGLQEALRAAKEQARDVYLAGGSWTADKTQPVVYHLHETLHVPWMQNFRLDSGHCVLNYTPHSGDAVVFDSQMSCHYRLGLIVSMSDGAVVRMRPATAGPDRFRVITSTEFVFNALVGGGGAWPGGEPHANQLDPKRRWVGTGLWLDGEPGSIDGNKITVLETVGCGVGLLLTGKVTRNTIEQTNIHLSQDHIRIGGAGDTVPADNRVEAFMDSQGIAKATGATVFGRNNLLTLSARRFSDGPGLVFEAGATGNLAIVHSPLEVVDRGGPGANRVVSSAPPEVPRDSGVPPSGQPFCNTGIDTLELRIVEPGQVAAWEERAGDGSQTRFAGPLVAGQSILLNPGDSIRLEYSRPPRWRAKAIR